MMSNGSVASVQSWRGLSCVTCLIEPQMVTIVGDLTLVGCMVGLDLWGTFEMRQ